MYHPFLVGDKIYLRGLEKADLAGKMFQWANDPEITHYMYMGTFPNSMEALEREYAAMTSNTPGSLLQMPGNPTGVVLAIIDKSDECHIGNVGLYNISWSMGMAEARIVIGERKYWGAGRAVEAYTLAIRYGFDRLNLRRIWAGCRADHTGSARSLEKVGFRSEGRQRRHFLRDGVAYDVLLFGLLREEFIQKYEEGRAEYSNGDDEVSNPMSSSRMRREVAD
jgi:ribosomal-protein-alanine N-acetyltransferase